MSSRGGIDYSKWDKFQDSSDEDDDTPNTRTPLAAPRVTRLDQPSRITTQADGSMLIQQQPPAKEVKQLSSSSPTLKQQEDQQSPSPPASWTDKGGTNTISVSSSTTTQDGASTTTTITVPLYWTQDRYSVTLRISTAAVNNKKPKYQVQVTNMLSFADRFVATAQPNLPILTVQQQQQGADGSMTLWIQETLPHPVYRAEDDDVDDDDNESSNQGNNLDWTLETWGDNNNNNNSKYLTIVLYKAVPMQGLTLWWNRPFTSCPETDISSWRKEDSSGSTSFQQAWKEAHAMFQDKMKSQKEGHS